MARLWTWGFEIGKHDANEYAYSGLSMYNNGTQSRTGVCGASMYFTNYLRRVLSSSLTEIYVRRGIYPSSPHPTGGNKTLIFVLANTDNERMVALRSQTDTDKIEALVWTGDAWSVIATSTNALTMNTYQCLEMHVKLHDTTGICEVRVDGSLTGWIDFDGDTIGDQTPADIKNVCYGGFDGTYPYAREGYIDDLAINDTSGAVNNSWCGQGGVYPMRPTAAGDHTGMTPSTGDNWECVNEIGPSDTDYVSTDTPDIYDLYATNDPTPDPGVGIVVTVRTFVRAKLATAGAGSIATRIKTEATEYTGSPVALDTTAKYLSTEYQTNPQTGVAWTLDEVKALQIGQVAKA